MPRIARHNSGRTGVSVAALALMTFSTVAQAQTLLAPKKWTRIPPTVFPRGKKGGQLGVVFPGVEAPVGPSAIVISDGHPVVLDQTNNRIVQFSPAANGRLRVGTEVPLPHASSIDEIVGTTDGVAAYDGRTHHLVRVDLGTKNVRTDPLELKRFDGLVPMTGGAFRIRGVPNGATQSIETEVPRPLPGSPQRPIRPEPRTPPPNEAVPDLRAVSKVTTGPNGARGHLLLPSVTGSEKKVDVQTPVPGSIAAMTVLGVDTIHRTFVRIEVFVAKNPIAVRRFILVYDENLALLDTFEYPTNGVVVPARDVAIDDVGNVSILLPSAAGTKILQFKAPLPDTGAVP